jgi:hypothetical protein
VRQGKEVDSWQKAVCSGPGKDPTITSKDRRFAEAARADTVRDAARRSNRQKKGRTMKRLVRVTLLALVLSVFATSPSLAADKPDQSQVPPDLRVPVGYKRVLESVGRGVQIYDCVERAWKFREPAAAIVDKGTDSVVAIHYVGPTWQSIQDGSKVVGAVKARLDAPNPQRDIPWLLLQATSTRGPGVFAEVAYIQRLDTVGGVAPSGACPMGQAVGVAYQATYAFWARTK